jgi:RimJ/RimL family protein N-acetyltransferase
MIDSNRLILRPWRDSYRGDFAAMSRDPEVMAHLGPVQDRAASDATIDRLIALQAARGHCFWAVERRTDGVFLGFCGLKIAPDRIPGLEGAIEAGWRLRRDAWGLGYAQEAAKASLEWAWAHLGVDRVIAITTPANQRSQQVMQRIGMVRRLDLDFVHPALAATDPLAPHVTYEIFRP